MELQKVTIKNFRSIEEITIHIIPLDDGTFTYSLIGVNEAGKSSILKALSLKGDIITPTLKDFRGNEPIEIIYCYRAGSDDIHDFQEHLKLALPSLEKFDSKLAEMNLIVSFAKNNPSVKTLQLSIDDIADDKDNIQESLKQLVLDKRHKSIFWTAEDKFLISKPINLQQFAQDPESISIPLKNCFSLAGITNIAGHIAGLSDSTEFEYLQTCLGESVTKHIKKVWPNHPIQITFHISDNLINFHIKDEGTNGKAKTADQRSDGFKQFVSFLLTVSAESRNDELSNSILLLDEPETHLHPQAQEYLLSELIKITKKNNNIVFLATHSNHMIDKNDLSRNYKVTKEKENTEISQFEKKFSSFGSIAYEVFDIPSTDYHNELYGFLQEKSEKYNISEFDSYLDDEHKLLKTETYKNKIKNKKENLTLPTKIRNQIHHPENTENIKFTPEDLKKSIDLMRTILAKPPSETKQT